VQGELETAREAVEAAEQKAAETGEAVEKTQRTE
jgi:hypothetical protein